MRQIGQYTARTEQETLEIADSLSKLFTSNDVILLEGDLGSGKTFLVKALCRIWETTDEAVSPTFAILHQYRGPQPVNHFDLYRIESVYELDNLGWEEFLEMGAITLIEWPQIIEDQLYDYYKIKIQIVNSKRIISLFKNEK